MVNRGRMRARPRSGFGRVFSAALLGLALLLCAAPVRSQGLELRNLSLDNQAGNLSVQFGLGVSGLEKIKATLAEGAELGLRCRVAVHRKRTLFFDSQVAGLDFESRLTADGLAQEYSVELPGGGKPLKGKDLGVLLDKAWGAVTLDLGPWSALAPGREYALSLSVSLKRLDVPTLIRVAAFFWSWDVAPPTQYELDFRL